MKNLIEKSLKPYIGKEFIFKDRFVYSIDPAVVKCTLEALGKDYAIFRHSKLGAFLHQIENKEGLDNVLSKLASEEVRASRDPWSDVVVFLDTDDDRVYAMDSNHAITEIHDRDRYLEYTEEKEMNSTGFTSLKYYPHGMKDYCRLCFNKGEFSYVNREGWLLPFNPSSECKLMLDTNDIDSRSDIDVSVLAQLLKVNASTNLTIWYHY